MNQLEQLESYINSELEKLDNSHNIYYYETMIEKDIYNRILRKIKEIKG